MILGGFWEPSWAPRWLQNRHKIDLKIDNFFDQIFDRFYVDFGAILAPNLAPKSLPKSYQTMLILKLGANLAPKRAQEAPRCLPEAPGNQFSTIFNYFWD